MMPMGTAVPVEAIATLQAAAGLAAGAPSRAQAAHGVHRRALRRLPRHALPAAARQRRPKEAKRADRDRPRSMPAAEIERWCEIVAAMKVRTTNKKGRHLSTARILQLLASTVWRRPRGCRSSPRAG